MSTPIINVAEILGYQEASKGRKRGTKTAKPEQLVPRRNSDGEVEDTEVSNIPLQLSGAAAHSISQLLLKLVECGNQQRLCPELVAMHEDIQQTNKIFAERLDKIQTLMDLQFNKLHYEIKKMKGQLQAQIQESNHQVLKEVRAIKSAQQVNQCRYCQGTTHFSAKCRNFPTGFERRERLAELNVCVMCNEPNDHVTCPRALHKCEVCGRVAGKPEAAHHVDNCDIRYPYSEKKMESARRSATFSGNEPRSPPGHRDDPKNANRQPLGARSRTIDDKSQCEITLKRQRRH